MMNKRGQSIIEYSLIAVLVILGIVYMGPYVLRSINAHFKLWDDGIQDSFTENITQAPLNDMPVINETCSCWDVKGDCGSATVGSQCGANERIYNHLCSATSPQGCDGEPASSCQPDQTCCSQYSDQGCGSIPIPTGGIPTGTVITSGTGPAGDPVFSHSNCQTYTNTGNNCYYNQKMFSTQCSPASVACCTDTADCAPHCLGIGTSGVLFCGSNSANPPSTPVLDENYGLTYVTGPSACTNSPPCQVYCDNSNGYFLNASGTGCTNDFEVAPNILTAGEGTPALASLSCPARCTCCYVDQSSTDTSCSGVTSVCTGGGCNIKLLIDCSFTMCPTADNNTTGTMTGVQLIDISTPETYPYCGNPGEPGEECKMVVTYKSNTSS